MTPKTTNYVKGREKERVRDVKVAIKTREKTASGTPLK